MRSRTSLTLVLGGLLSGLGYFVAPRPWSDICYDAPAFAAVAACLLAARRAPARRASWLLLAAGTAAFLVGDLVYDVWDSFPGPADAVYLIGYPLLGAGLIALLPHSRVGMLAASLDAALATAAVSLFIFLFWLEPIFAQHGVSTLARLISCAYPVSDLLLVAVLLMVVLQTAEQRLLLAAVVVLLVADLAYSGLLANTDYEPGTIVDAGWLASYTLFGLAALHQSATVRSPAPAVNARSGGSALSWRRLVFVGACLFAVPLAGLGQLLTSTSAAVGDLTAWGALIALCACLRLVLVARERSRAEQHFQALIETTDDIVMIVGDDGILRYVSPAVERILGLAPSHYVGRSVFAFVHPDDHAALAEGAERILEGTPKNMNFRVEAADGSYRHVLATGRQLERGPYAGSLLVDAHDVTARLAVEAELANRDEQLRQAQKMEAIGQLAGGVAHDFNNLLLAIRGYGEVARIEAAALSGGEGVASDIGEMLTAADRAAALTRQLLAFSRRQRLDPRQLDLNNALHDLDSLLRRLIAENVEIVTVCADEPAWVEVDAGQLEQVVINLAVNARDAMPEGGTLTLAVAAEDETVALTVTDTGCGMDEQTKARVFEPFFTTKDVGAGTGFGLATVYGIVAQSGGEITLESALGTGSSFTVTLPRIVSPAPAPSEHPAPVSVERPAANCRLLLVEDHLQVRTIVGTVLRSGGYEVLEAADGAEALPLLQRQQIDLLISDVVMPHMSGPELAGHARELNPGLPVILCSGYAADSRNTGGDVADYLCLEKPFSAAELLEAVRSSLGAGSPAGSVV
jgi:PAS domain S-box-containing protein